ncbi:HRDC-like protein [Dendryphion nanum]|uniref:DNA-directed RNA polymerase III subunit RPC9 n=1 Tax=Dendryphion nanum TaxID=256645 RepID=A0A9P9E580_9PLEO|nr:HRDC-like protein [Dendryphion nanum]
MHIKQAQTALLSNHEVLLHLRSVAAEYDDAKERRPCPKGLSDMLQDGLAYLQSTDQNEALTTLASTRPKRPMTLYKGPHSLFRALAPLYRINKAEYLQIYNLRPTSAVTLCLIIEEYDTRFTDEQLEDILSIITRVFDEEEQSIPPGVESQQMDKIKNKLLGASKKKKRLTGKKRS